MLWIVISMLIEIDTCDFYPGEFHFKRGVPAVPVVYKEFRTSFPVGKVEISPVSVETLSVTKGYPPSYGPMKLNGSSLPEPVRDVQVYGSDSPFPGVYGKILSKGFRDDLYVVNLVLYPVQYIPAWDKVILVKEFDITFVPGSVERNVGFSGKSGAVYENVNLDMVIITSSEFSQVLEELAKWKNGFGIHTRVFTVDWIDEYYPGVDLQEKIRNFIKDVHEKFGVQFVLLGGNEHVIPAREVYCNSAYYTGPMITDLYYADLDGTWDEDRDGVFGENTDSIDGYPDVAVGRLPFERLEDFEHYIEKVKMYERTFPFQGELFLMGASVYTYSDGWGQRNSEIIASTVNGVQTITKLYSPPVDTFTGYKLWRGELLNRASALDNFEQGYNLISHLDHGDIWYVGTGILQGGSKVYGSDLIEESTINGVMITIACYPNAWNMESFSEAYLKGSGVGFIGNVKTGWTSQSIQQKAFFEGLYQDSLWHLGKLWMKTIMGDIYFRYVLSLLGDPSLKVWWSRPYTLTYVGLPQEVKTGVNRLCFVAEGEDGPVFGEVFVYQPGTGLFAREKLLNGEAKMLVSIPDTGTVIVGIVSPNHLPVIDTLWAITEGGFRVVDSQVEDNNFSIIIKNTYAHEVSFSEVYLKLKGGEAWIDSFPVQVEPQETFKVSGHVGDDTRWIYGDLVIKETGIDDSTMINLFIPVNLSNITLSYVQMKSDRVIDRLYIVNRGQEPSRDIVYGIEWWIGGRMDFVRRKYGSILPFSVVCDTEDISLPVKYDSMFIFVGKDTFPFNPEIPWDSVISFNTAPGPSCCQIQFATTNSNRYNIYVDGRRRNIYPLTSRTYTIEKIDYRPHIVEIRPVSASGVEGSTVYLDTIFPNPPEEEGWPVFVEYPEYMESAETYNLPSSAAGDIDGDGEKEIIVMMPSGNLFVYKIEGYLINEVHLVTGSITRNSPSVYDLDGDGKDEIVIGGGLNDTVDLRILGDGIITGGSGKGFNPFYPVIWPVSGNGSVLYYTWDGWLHRVDRYCMELPGWPVNINGVLLIATGELVDVFPEPEIVAASYVNNSIYVLTSNGEIIDTIYIGSRPKGIVCGDFDGDGMDEIAALELNGVLHVFEVDGTEVSGFPFSQTQQVLSELSAGDVDGDGLPELVFVTRYGRLYVIDNEGTVILNKQIPRINSIRYISPVIADLDGDGDNDILVHSTDGKLYGVTITGENVPGFPIHIGSVSGITPLVDDIDGDGRLELLIRDDAGYVHLYQLQGSRVDWGTCGGHAGRSGWYELSANRLSLSSLQESDPEKGLRGMLLPEILKGERVIEVLDVTGRVMMRGKVLNTGGLSPGVFFVRDGENVKKFLKIR